MVMMIPLGASAHDRTTSSRISTHSDIADGSETEHISQQKRSSRQSNTRILERHLLSQHNETQTAPPAYSVYAPQESIEIDNEKERLRRFLSHLLSLDYGLRRQCPDKLLKEDWLHFNRLGKIAFKTFVSHHRATKKTTILLDWSDKCCWHPDIDRYITKPARTMGISTSKLIETYTGYRN